MSSKRQRKRKSRQRRHALPAGDRPQRTPRPPRPTPVEAIALHHQRQAALLASRPERFFQILSGAVRDERDATYLVSTSGLTEEQREELLTLAPAAHEIVRRDLDAALGRLRSQLATWDPLYATAILQLSTIWRGWGTYYEPTETVGEHHVELVGGFLCTDLPSAEREERTGERLDALRSVLDEIMGLLLLVNISRPPNGDLDDARLRLRSTMRWLLLRGESYGTHALDLATALAAPFSGWMTNEYGFDFDDVVKVVEGVEDRLHERVNGLIQEGVERSRDLIATYEAEHAQAKPTDEEVSALLRMVTFAHVSEGIRDAMSFTANELAAADIGVEESRVAAVLAKLSIPAGSLPASAYTGLFDPNPLRLRPFLESSGRYILVSPAMALRDAVVLVDETLLGDRPGYPASRAKTLDRLAVEYLTAMLPGADSHLSLFYEGAELDGLVLFEDVAIVVEGKAGAISVPALRGDIERLRRDLARTVQEAWEQGARASEYLLADGDFHVLRREGRRGTQDPCRRRTAGVHRESNAPRTRRACAHAAGAQAIGSIRRR